MSMCTQSRRHISSNLLLKNIPLSTMIEIQNALQEDEKDSEHMQVFRNVESTRTVKNLLTFYSTGIFRGITGSSLAPIAVKN
jgi:hypothetical protein